MATILTQVTSTLHSLIIDVRLSREQLVDNGQQGATRLTLYMSLEDSAEDWGYGVAQLCVSVCVDNFQQTRHQIGCVY